MGKPLYADPSNKSEPHRLRHGRDHAALAVRTGGGDTPAMGRSDHYRRDAGGSRPGLHQRGGCGRDRDPHEQRPARLRGRSCGARPRGPRGVRRYPCDVVPGRGIRTRWGARDRYRRRRHHLAAGDRRLRRRNPAAHLRRGPGGRSVSPESALGSDAAQPVHVGIGPDRARLPEALLVLLGLAHGRPGTAPANRRRRHRGSGRTAPDGIPVHRAGGRQLLSGHPRRPSHGRTTQGPSALAGTGGSARGTVRTDGAPRETPVRHGVLHADYDGGSRGSRVSGSDARGRASRAR